jgi:hypothetical protein
MLRSAVRLARKFRREKYVVDDEGERGLVKVVWTWNIGSCRRVPFGAGKRARRTSHATIKVGGRKELGRKFVAGK